MPVRVQIPTPMRQHTEGKTTVEAQGATVKAVLDNLVAVHPGLSARISIDSVEILLVPVSIRVTSFSNRPPAPRGRTVRESFAALTTTPWAVVSGASWATADAATSHRPAIAATAIAMSEFS